MQPYDFEPTVSDGDEEEDSDESETVEASSDDDEHEMTRIGNTNWCNCGECRSMLTYEESLCCKDDVPRDMMADSKCITEHKDFAAVCLNIAVLRTTLSMLNNLRGDNLSYENNALRYAAYRQFTWWVHNRLGKGVRRVIPSCAIWAIRDKFPQENNVYEPFRESSEEEARLL